jgi:hypothetical protein
MNKKIRVFPAFLALTIAAAVACSLFPSGIGGTQTPSPDQVATAVAMTLQALTPDTDAGEPTPEPSAQPSASPSDLLPHTFYYLGTDTAGLTQVFRIERDGTSQSQLTFEPVNVNDYGASPADGSVAYVANNQLLFVNADSSGRRVLVDGGPVDENSPFLTLINSPVFSPDGQTLAYGYKGLNLYAVSTGASDLVIENQIDDSNSGFLFPKELYWPEAYSPDGTKLLITLGYYEGASSAIYYPASNALVRLQGGEGALICCGETEWTPDSSSFYAANPSMGMFSSGLWKVDAATGAVTELIRGDAGDGNYNLADEPYPTPDGQLYFFFATVSSPDGIVMRPPLQLVRSAPDGVTARTTLLPDTFELMNEALWAPDASFVVVAYAPTQEVVQGGQAEIIYLDGRPNVVLTTFAQQMKWGL